MNIHSLDYQYDLPFLMFLPSLDGVIRPADGAYLYKCVTDNKRNYVCKKGNIIIKNELTIYMNITRSEYTFSVYNYGCFIRTVLSMDLLLHDKHYQWT